MGPNDAGQREEEEAVALENAARRFEDQSWRTSAPQILATMAQSMLLLSLGMFVSVPTMVIGSLHNATTGLSMNDQQASWFVFNKSLLVLPLVSAGLLLINQPLGSLLSGFVQDAIGRKRCMLFVNLPQIAAWILLYSAQTIGAIFVAAVMMGFSIGFLEAPSFSYVGEVCQPHLRGRLATFMGLFVAFGTLLVYLLGAITDWRTLSAISASVPVLTIICVLQIPESPVWLVLKGRDEEAKKSLAWLRGWVSVEEISKEFEHLKDHMRTTQKCKIAAVTNGTDYKPVPVEETGEPALKKPNWRESIRSIMQPDMLKPLRMTVMFFFFYHCAAFNGSRPYLVVIFKKLHTSVDPFIGPVVAVVCLILGAVTCIICIRKVGKRTLSLLSMSLCTFITFTLGVYSYFHHHNGLTIPLFPIILYCCLYFSSNLGIGVIPWNLLSEVFPTRGKGLGGGISAAFYYVWFFLASKTFMDLDSLIGLSGVCFFYSALGTLGIVFVYYCVPETEGKTLKEVEDIFKSKAVKPEQPSS